MNVRADMLVREITTAYPESLRQLERWGIDYCCGGGQRLEDACRRANAPLTEVMAYVASLAEKSPARTMDLRTLPLEDVVRHIETTHHAFTRSELERAMALAVKVHRVHGARHPELERVRTELADLRDELLTHMMKEEQVLFAAIAAMEESGAVWRGTIHMPIACMTAEHEDAGAMLESLKTLTNGFTPPEDACGSYRALYQSLQDLDRDLRTHMHVENDILFPRALALEATRRVA
jgi:regulator of cell morphogenesis and NO signaling